MAPDILSELELSPGDVPGLPARARSKLISFLLHQGHHDTARRCLQQLLVTHSHLVSVYDALARAYLGLGRAEDAVEIVRRRQALKTSQPSLALLARTQLAAGDVEAALATTEALLAENPDSGLGWTVRGDVLLAAGDVAGAEAAYRQLESLRPGSPSAAHHLARFYRHQGQADEALRLARQSAARIEEQGGRPVPTDYLRLLETLLREAGHAAEAEAIAAELRARQAEEWAALRATLGLDSEQTRPTPQQAHPTPTPHEPSPIPPPLPGEAHASLQFPASNLQPPASNFQIQTTPAERERLNEALTRYFGFDAFRPGQAEVMASVLRGENVLAVMPTGAGKSLCYQLPAMLLPQTTLVISPLIALMKDQVDSLPPAVGRQATTINSTLDGGEIRARLEAVAAGQRKLVYAAPERLRQRPFLHALAREGVSLLVIDEAHCVSLWGHDFRPDYLFITKALAELGHPPLLAMTATATPRIQKDIQAQLGAMRLIATDVHRPNLRLEAVTLRNDDEKMQALLKLCREQRGSGIVYANARKKCERLAWLLRKNGIQAIHYHAGIDDRAAVQDRFMSGRVRIVVATVAFGMGIDKADIRFIVHYHPPKSLENYYQEAGRAGRDGRPSRCILFYAPSDKGNLTRWSRQDALHIELLRVVYAALRRRLGEGNTGLVAGGDLERDCQAEETAVRVAISLLERVGLVTRHFDLPRVATVTIHHDAAGEDYARFVEAARLRPHQPLPLDLARVSQQAGLDPATVEAQLLAWADRGWLDYRGAQRDMLLTLLPPPPDVARRLNDFLAGYRAGQDRRIEEMVGYATTTGCRHGHLSAYFGGRPIERCPSCDNCTTATFSPPPRRAVVVDADANPLQAILRCLNHLPIALGKPGLARVLKGSPDSPVSAGRCPEHGALAHLSKGAITHHVNQLADEGYLEYYHDRDFRLIRLTDKGRAALADPSLLPESPVPAAVRAEVKRERRKPGEKGDIEEGREVDAELLRRLRAWRTEKARTLGVSAFVVFHNAVLERIAAHRPTNLDALGALKGIGPGKLEKYGAEVLEIVRGEERG